MDHLIEKARDLPNDLKRAELAARILALCNPSREPVNRFFASLIVEEEGMYDTLLDYASLRIETED